MEMFAIELRNKQTSFSPGIVPANMQTVQTKDATTPNDTIKQDTNHTTIVTPSPSQESPPILQHKPTGKNQKRETIKRRRDQKCSTAKVARKRKKFGFTAVGRKNQKIKS